MDDRIRALLDDCERTADVVVCLAPIRLETGSAPLEDLDGRFRDTPREAWKRAG